MPTLTGRSKAAQNPAHFAAQNPAQQRGGRELQGSRKKRHKPLTIKGLCQSVANPCDTVQTYLVPPRGVEPLFSD